MQENLATIRRKAGYSTQEQFCKAVGVERATVARWETGIRYPRTLMIPKIAAILNITSDDVIAAITVSNEHNATKESKPATDKTA